tara:strand:- start:654 stop:824 length:171 start_codon:yes stop_codon:yes gene_type:complete
MLGKHVRRGHNPIAVRVPNFENVTASTHLLNWHNIELVFSHNYDYGVETTKIGLAV